MSATALVLLHFIGAADFAVEAVVAVVVCGALAYLDRRTGGPASLHSACVG